MSTIAFWMVPEQGHILPTFRLASALRARGHRVCYFTIPDFEELVTENGFEHVPVYERLYPRGEWVRMQQLSPAELAEREREMIEFCRAYFVDGLADERLHRVAPDLVLCDVMETKVAMAAHHWKIPFLRLSTSLSQTPAPGVPPLCSSMPFDGSPAGIAAAERAWDEHISHPAEPEVQALYERMGEAIRRRYDFPAALVDPRATFIEHLVGFPELVLCSPALDYPRPPSPLRHHVESLWLERREPEFPWHAMDLDRPWIYCSLGSQAHRIQGARRFFAELFAATRRMPAWQFVIALGGRFTAADFGEIPGNAVVVQLAPQLALLRKSQLVITHGGLGTLKESVFFGVPVLVFPLLFDQPGNGARVLHHRLGLVGDFQTATAAEIAGMARRVLDDPEIPHRVAAVQSSLHEIEDALPGVALVERALAAARGR
jgi:zeaxanthin glucosyltransferase